MINGRRVMCDVGICANDTDTGPIPYPAAIGALKKGWTVIVEMRGDSFRKISHVCPSCQEKGLVITTRE